MLCSHLQIFDKAVLEPTFCPLYAELCVKLSKALPEFNEGEDKPVTFRRVMLNTCQEEFEAAESLRDEVKRMTVRVYLEAHFLRSADFVTHRSEGFLVPGVVL